MTVFEQLTSPQQHQVFMRARDLGLCEITYHGGWQLTRDGRMFLDMLDALRELDDRPGATRGSSPRRQAPPTQRSGAAARPKGARRGDDVPAARGSQEKGT